MKITIVGAGRAGSSFCGALRKVGYDVRLVHHDELSELGGAELVLLCVPDDVISIVSSQVARSTRYVVAHVAGSRGLSELGDHHRVALIHPLAALPNAELGAQRLESALFSVGGDEIVDELVVSLHGRSIRLRDDQRALYHAAASVTANHLVALMGHVEVLAQGVGMDLDDFVPLAQQALHDVAQLGVRRALTGPASRADMATIDAHLAVIPSSQRATYVAMANAAFELAEAQRLRVTV